MLLTLSISFAGSHAVYDAVARVPAATLPNTADAATAAAFAGATLTTGTTWMRFMCCACAFRLYHVLFGS